MQVGNIEKRHQYNKFETFFNSKRREDVTSIFNNIKKDDIVSIIDSYDEMIHQIKPDAITISECMDMAVENGIIEPNINDSDNSYRQLAEKIIGEVEDELFDILPEPTDEGCPDDTELSKICGEMYYSLEDRLTYLFRDSKL
jgi:hypothetical protein